MGNYKGILCRKAIAYGSRKSYNYIDILYFKGGNTMKTCPGCGEILGDSVKSCFNCNYNYTLGRIITDEERQLEKQQQLQIQEEKEKFRKTKEEQRKKQLSNNPIYEYQTIVISDNTDGRPNTEEIQSTLDQWSDKGWRLHSIVNTEIGSTIRDLLLRDFTERMLSVSKVPPLNQIILIFERCIKA